MKKGSQTILNDHQTIVNKYVFFNFLVLFQTYDIFDICFE